ncbi:MAG TPA: thioredoxin domain-containing protein [Gemmatimonadales bacterium]|nr:thioredoxin domain-containing protein [Gemmatimonadales bacterium]
MTRTPAALTAALLCLATAAGARPLSAQAGADPGPMIAERSKGDPKAPITVFEMSDFQCPFCRKFFLETFPALERDYVQTGKVHWIFLNLPISELHPNAEPAAEFAMCSAKFGKFWPVHDLLYHHQDLWAPLKEPGTFLLTLADSVGLPRDSLLPCLQKHEMQARVGGDAASAARAGARATPSFLIDGALLTGAYPLEVFQHVLDSIYTVRMAARKP